MIRRPVRLGVTNDATKGMALISVLIVVTLITLLIVAFMFLMQQDSYSSRNYNQSIKAEEIGLGALDQIVSQYKQEIIAGSTTTNILNGTTIYLPTTNFTAVPADVGVSANLTNVVERSVGDNTIYGAAYSNPAYYPNTTPVNLASTINSTASTSFNGRYVSAARWSKPQLDTFTSSSQTPDWVILTRQGAKQFTVWDTSLRDKTSANYALGRYAYVIYNTGGLLNANIAGYAKLTPPSGTTFDNETGAKSSTVWADLTSLGLTQTQVDNLVAWRNHMTSVTPSSYLDYATNFGATNGFTIVDGNATASDNTFLSRQDLIDYANTNGFTAALPYLATFSREVNSPSATVNGTNLATVEPGGQPLHRFPLSKIALLSEDNPNAADQSQIAQYFGLTEAAGFSATYRHWTYTQGGGTSAPILALSAVAASGRQPNLFEVLLAGIQKGSLGQPGVSGAANNNLLLTYGDDSNVYHQIIRIGANIIDQATTSNYPTVIDFPDNNGNTYQFYGIKNLPYFNELCVKYMVNTSPAEEHYIFFQLWNPHRNASAVAASDPKIQVYVNPEATLTTSNGSTSYGPYSFASNTGASIDIGIGANNTYANPSLITSSGTPGCTYTLGTDPTRSPQITFSGWKFPNNPPNSAPSSTFDTVLINNALFQLQYKDGTGIYRTYATFGGPLKSGGTIDFANFNGLHAPSIQYYGGWVGESVYIGGSSLYFLKSDPRTNRFGAAETNGNYRYIGPLVDSTLTSLAPNGFGQPGEMPIDFDSPAYCGLSNSSYFGRLWTNQDSSSKAHDPDGLIRPGDGYLGDNGNNNPLRAGSDSNAYDASRPVILNRPYQSVGELGYVFRDQPWKTLDLFSSKSADSALLDMFCINEDQASVRTDTVNINTQHPAVLQSLLSGAYRDPYGAGTANQVSTSDAAALAQDIISSSQTNTFANVADLINKPSGYSGTTVTPSTAYPAVKSQREALPRALASIASTRTWNLMIDIIAQSGQYPRTASSLDNFLVEGEKRYWLHIAIDRYTGKIIDQSLEQVWE